MTPRITGISSMATRALLAELAASYQQRSATAVAIESVGGVDAARRVQAGEPFDLVFLAGDAIDRLIAADAVVAGSRVDLVSSPVAVAAPAGAPAPDVASEEALKRAVLAARRIGYSTGPSGTHLMRLFEQWGIAPALAGRVVQAPPGVPVGRLVAEGEVDLGFQQYAELMNEPGIRVLGLLPGAAQFVTTFAGGLCRASQQAAAARAVLAFMASPETAEAKRRHGMQPI